MVDIQRASPLGHVDGTTHGYDEHGRLVVLDAKAPHRSLNTKRDGSLRVDERNLSGTLKHRPTQFSVQSHGVVRALFGVDPDRRRCRQRLWPSYPAPWHLHAEANR